MPTTDKNRNGRHSHKQNQGSKAQGDPVKNAAQEAKAKDGKDSAPKKDGSGKSDESE